MKRRKQFKIILISGKQGSGKDTLATELKELLQAVEGAKVQQFMFADTIYNIHNYARRLLHSLGIEVDFSNKDGELLRFLGTEWGRYRYGMDVWARVAFNQIMKWPCKMDYAIITDNRFKNEFNMFPDAIRVRLTAPEKVRKKRRGKTWRKDTKHISEVDLDGYEKQGKFDVVLDTQELAPEACAAIVYDLINQ